MTAILFPTGISSPAEALIFDRIPEAGASISTVALSVSTSMSGSPLVTDWPSALSQLSRVPFSCATPSAGMITSVAIIVARLSQEGFSRKAQFFWLLYAPHVGAERPTTANRPVFSLDH